MIVIDKSTIHVSRERKLAAGTTNVREGQALVADFENGELVVKPSAGSNNEKFVGVAVSSVTSVTTATVRTTVSSDSSDNIVLDHAPVANTFRIAKASAPATALTSVANVAAVDANTKYNLTDKTVHVNESSTSYILSYRYTLSTLESLSLQGDVEPGTPVSNSTGTVGVIMSGEVYTDEWVTTVNWLNTSAVYTAASGRFSTTAVTGQSSLGLITHLPDSDSGLLGFQFSAI